jgi:uncharacterized protein (DUF433 family)
VLNLNTVPKATLHIRRRTISSPLKPGNTPLCQKLRIGGCNRYTSGQSEVLLEYAMTANTVFVPTAEAAFIAGVSDREMNRVVDEHILPADLFRNDNGRTFTRLGAAFTHFYFKTERHFLAEFRRQILTELAVRLKKRPDRNLILALPERMPIDLDWHIVIAHARIDVAVSIAEASKRVREVEQADLLVKVSPEVLGGLAVFSGTRVPIDTVVASLDKGIDRRRVMASYPFLTDEHIKAARVYTEVHPQKGRPRRMSETHPRWKLKSSSVVRSATKA